VWPAESGAKFDNSIDAGYSDMSIQRKIADFAHVGR
jgi:hypothetical protein